MPRLERNCKTSEGTPVDFVDVTRCPLSLSLRVLDLLTRTRQRKLRLCAKTEPRSSLRLVPRQAVVGSQGGRRCFRAPLILLSHLCFEGELLAALLGQRAARGLPFFILLLLQLHQLGFVLQGLHHLQSLLALCILGHHLVLTGH